MSADPATAAHVVVIGDALIDRIVDADGTRDFVGGAGLNVAVGLRTLGVPTTLIATLGADADGASVREYLRDHDVTLLASSAELGTSVALSERVDGEPRYVFNAAAQHREIAFTAEVVSAIDAATLVVVSCFPFDNPSQSAALAARVHRPESRLVIDPNPRAGMLSDRNVFVENFEALAGRSLLTKVGDEDAQLLYGSSLEELRDRLLAAGARTVLATAGRDGATITTSAGVTTASGITDMPGEVIDTMGAGDATLAASVSALVHDGVPEQEDGWSRLLSLAMDTAAATCRVEGALLQPHPSRQLRIRS
ncbi:MAG: PfkB family carbohydrate kinase [Microterricola sp.]